MSGNHTSLQSAVYADRIARRTGDPDPSADGRDAPLSRWRGSQKKRSRQNFTVIREAVDKFYGDRARCPYTLEELVERKYIRNVPVDPVHRSPNTWLLVPPSDGAGERI